ncbi:MAG: Ig-like domain-containing protein [Isosphaeraceae bacterium]
MKFSLLGRSNRGIRWRPVSTWRTRHFASPKVEALPDRCLLSLDVMTFPLWLQDEFGYAGDITTGADRNLWFSAMYYEAGSFERHHFIGRMTPAGQLTRFPVQVPVDALTAGPDGSLWFTSNAEETIRIGRMTLDGQVTMFAIPSSPDHLGGITAGPDGNVWFTMSTSDPDTDAKSGSVAKVTPDGRITEYPLHEQLAYYGDGFDSITAGPDGNVWFTVTVGLGDPNGEVDSYREVGRIGRITPNGRITEFCLGKVPPTPSRWPIDEESGSVAASDVTFKAIDITAGSDGNLWFTQTETLSMGAAGDYYSRFERALGKIDTQGHITRYAAPTRDVPFRIITGSDQNLWYTTYTNTLFGGAGSDNDLGRFTPSGITTSFPGVTKGYNLVSALADITNGPDGAIWASTADSLVRIVPPTTTVGQMSLSTDKGVWNDDHVTNNRHPAFEGTAQPGTTVRLYARSSDGQGLTLIAQTASNRRGEWQAQARALPDGAYSILVSIRPAGRGQRYSPPVPLYPFTDQVKSTAPRPNTSYLVIDTIAPRVTGLKLSPQQREIDVEFQDLGGSGFFFWEPIYPGPTNPACEEFVAGPNASVKRPHTANELGNYIIGDERPLSPNDPYGVTISLWDGAPPPYFLRYFSKWGVYDVAGNALDGEYHGQFPSGDGHSGGDFVSLLRSTPSQRARRRLAR